MFIVGLGYPANNQCQVCSKSYRYAHNLRRHQAYECTKSLNFGCPYCNYKSNRADTIYRHQRKKHQDQEVYCFDHRIF